MSQQNSFSDMFELYLLNRKILKDWTFIVATTEPGNINLYESMDELEGIKERLYTPFANGRVSIINNKILRRCLWKRDARARTYRNVSFDTQTVSYIERYYKNGTVPYKGFDSVVKLLNGAGFGIDHIPYTLENMLFDTSRKNSVEQTLYAYEMLCSENAGNERICRNRAHAIVSMYENKEFVIPFRTKELYKMVYLSLLKMSQIQLGYDNLSITDKLDLFVDFMATSICKIMQPEINLAKHYFTKGNGCGFFGKIQIGNKSILNQLKNMTWDLLHLRFMDYSSAMFNAKKADALIPYFFTYDKRLQDIRTCYSLQALAINSKNFSVIPIYVFHDEVLHIAKSHLTFEKHKERMEHKSDVDSLIEICEKELKKLV